MTPTPDFSENRRRLVDTLAPDEAVLLFGAPHPLRNGDSEYRYRPDSDVYWLTGWTDPEVAVFLRPGDEPLVMFVQKKDKTREVWTGFRPGPQGAEQDFGADVAYPWSALDAELPRLLQGVQTLHYAFARNPEHDALVASAIQKAARAARKSGLSVPETFHALSHRVHELRLRKTPSELAVLRHAAHITDLAHREAMATAADGVPEFAIEALIDGTFRGQGGTGAGYTTIVAGGANACVLHYITNRAPLKAGDLLLIDAGCELSYYTADVTRTFPVSGRFSPAQAQVYSLVLDAQLAAIDQARAGVPYSAMHDAAVRVLTEGMVALGLLKGNVDTLISDESYKRYYMHGTGHWLGLDVHDAGRYARSGESRLLEPGMVVTVEPGLYIPPDDEDAPEALRGIGVRIEDDIVITDGEPENLTAAIPKTIAEVEAACLVVV